MLLDVTHVTVQPHFTLPLEFANGERRTFHMPTYMDQNPWARLKRAMLFRVPL
jgi:hypothetical protein